MSVVDDALDGLVERFRAAVPDVHVYEGPDRDALTEGRTHLVFVGTDGEALMVADGDDTDGVRVSESRSSLGTGDWRDLSAEVTCAVWTWAGDADMRARRREAEEIARACAASVHADRSLGGLLTPPGLADVTEYGYRLRHTTKGAVARVVFTVTFSHLVT